MRVVKNLFKINKASLGFTLTEVVIVLALIGVLLVGILPLFLNAVSSNKSNYLYSKAYKLLDSKIEEQRSLDFNSITSETYQITDLPSGQGILTVTNNVDGVSQADIKKLNLKITWDFQRTREVEIETYVARNGLKR